MKNLIIISNFNKGEFNQTVKHLKSRINQANIDNWSNLEFLNRVIIITKNEQVATALYNYLINYKIELGLANNSITFKENFLTDGNVHFEHLNVKTEIDYHFENKLSRSSTMEFQTFTQLPSPQSPAITVDFAHD